MKKIYLTTSLIASLSLAIAQAPMIRMAAKERAQMPYAQQLQTTTESGQTGNSDVSLRSGGTRGAVIFSEDFANGLPSTWKTFDSNTFCDWKYTKVGSQGQFGEVLLNSTTKANGYMILDADFCNFTAHGANQSKFQDVSAYVQTPKIDLSSYPDVNLNFQHTLRYCCNPRAVGVEVQVSNDDINWTSFDILKDLLFNDNTRNAASESINISEVAGGQKSVSIRFYFGGVGVYYWMIDDVAIVTSPANDMILKNTFVDFFYEGSGNYTQTPMSQASISFRGLGYNGGVNPQTNVVLNVNIKNRALVSVYNQNSDSLPSVPKFQFDTFKIATPFVPTTVGSYTLNYSLRQDSIDIMPNNNKIPENYTAISSLSISDTVYARDNGTFTGSVSPSSYVQNGTAVDGANLGTSFDFGADEEINSVSVFVHSDSEIGSSFTCKVYDGTFTDLLLTTIFYEIDAANKKGKMVTLPFTNKDGTIEKIAKGASVVVAIETYGAPNKVFIGNDTRANQPSGISWLLPDPSNPTQWFTIREQPIIRLNIGGCSTVDIQLDSMAYADTVKATGAIYTTITGGGGNTIKWTGLPAKTPSNGGQTLTGLSSKTKQYTVTVTEANGCSKKASYKVQNILECATTKIRLDSIIGANPLGAAYTTVTGGIKPLSYSWYPSGGIAADETGLELGNNTLSVIDAKGCVQKRVFNVTEKDAVGIAELRITNYELRIYPNPSNGRFTITNYELGITIKDLKIMNVLGQVVYQSTIVHPKSAISLNVPAGIYFLQVQTEKEVITRKLVIE